MDMLALIRGTRHHAAHRRAGLSARAKLPMSALLTVLTLSLLPATPAGATAPAAAREVDRVESKSAWRWIELPPEGQRINETKEFSASYSRRVWLLKGLIDDNCLPRDPRDKVCHWYYRVQIHADASSKGNRRLKEVHVRTSAVDEPGNALVRMTPTELKKRVFTEQCSTFTVKFDPGAAGAFSFLNIGLGASVQVPLCPTERFGKAGSWNRHWYMPRDGSFEMSWGPGGEFKLAGLAEKPGDVRAIDGLLYFKTTSTSWALEVQSRHWDELAFVGWAETEECLFFC